MTLNEDKLTDQGRVGHGVDVDGHWSIWPRPLITYCLKTCPVANSGSRLRPTSPISDIKALAGNKSYMLSTVAFTCVCYCAGALMWWGPNFAFTGAKSAAGNTADADKITLADISFR